MLGVSVSTDLSACSRAACWIVRKKGLPALRELLSPGTVPLAEDEDTGSLVRVISSGGFE
jgi:hypothetical protein